MQESDGAKHSASSVVKKIREWHKPTNGGGGPVGLRAKLGRGGPRGGLFIGGIMPGGGAISAPAGFTSS